MNKRERFATMKQRRDTRLASLLLTILLPACHSIRKEEESSSEGLATIDPQNAESALPSWAAGPRPWTPQTRVPNRNHPRSRQPPRIRLSLRALIRMRKRRTIRLNLSIYITYTQAYTYIHTYR